ncbi:MAG TPA: ABC transporter substrate-binding protein [Thermomicrobiales bacterium]|nr:ABC transporter substrate-binding protein [Thermomicrobiales bacterium]
MSNWSGNRRDLMKIAGAAAAVTGMAMTTGGRLAWAQDASPESGDFSGELIYGRSEESVGFDPAMVTATSSFEVIAAAYESLIIFDDDGQPQPWLAESWDMPDDTTYIFKLRDGVTFHNGQPLTAKDVVFTFERLMDPDGGSPWTSQFTPVDSVEATDDLTVTFKLKETFGPFLSPVSARYAAILPADDSIDFQSTMVGTGAFKLDEFKKDTETRFAGFADYWQEGQPKLAGMVYKILPDESSRVAAIRTGEIQLTSLVDPISVDTVKGSDGVSVINQDSTDYYLLGLNCKQAPFDDVKVRQALSMAIDRQAIIDSVFFGQGQESGPIVPTMGDWANPLEDLPNYQVDRDAAKALLEEAGQSGLSFKITVGANRQEFVNIALVIQDQLKEIGVNAELDQVEWGTFIDKWVSRDFQSFVSFNGSGNDPDSALYAALTTDGTTNAFQFSDPDVDKLLNEGRTLADHDERKKVYQEAEMKIADQAPLIFICTRVGNFAVRDNVHGFAPTASQTWATLPETTVDAE